MPSNNKGGYVRWDDEWLIVTKGALPHIDKGVDRFTACKRGQQLLPKDRRLSDEELRSRLAKKGAKLTAAIHMLRAMTPEQREGLMFRARDEGARYTHADGTRVQWRKGSVEVALLARRIAFWQKNGDKRTLPRLFAEAQELELPPERRRPHRSMYTNNRLPELLADGLTHQHLLAGKYFHPYVTSYEAAQAPRPAPPAPPKIDEPEAKPVEAATAAEATTPAPSPEKPPVGPFAALPEAPALPPVPGHSSAHDMARWFGVSLANALVPMFEHVLTVHEASVMERVRLNAQAQQGELVQALLSGIDKMLGGQGIPHVPVAAQPIEVPAPAAAAVVPEAPEALKLKPLKIDVVGFEQGQHEMLVSSQLNGHAQEVDLRFIHPDRLTSYSPHRDRAVVMLVTRISHSLAHKIKASGCKTVYVKRTVGHAVKAIESLLDERAKFASLQ